MWRTYRLIRPAILVLALLLARFAFATALPAQSEMRDAALAPIAAIGKISMGEKGIIFNTLQSTLSKTYRLVSQKEYARAEERAFQELEEEQCTEEQCIRKIQEILQVERLFVLQIIRERNYTQLTLSLMLMDERVVRTDTCKGSVNRGCAVSALDAKVAGLVAALAKADSAAAAQRPPPRRPPPAPAADEAGITPLESPDEDGGIASVMGWGLGVVALVSYLPGLFADG